MKVLAFGEILWDIIEGEKYLGGAPFNFAAHCVQCGNDASVISRLGNDVLGIQAYDECRRRNVKSDFIQFDQQHPTGTVTVTLLKGQPDYIIHENVAYDFIDDSKVLQELGHSSADVVYFGSLAQRNDTSRQTLHNLLGRLKCEHIFYDVNLRKGGYNESILRESLKFSTIFKLNLDELPVVSRIFIGVELQAEAFCRSIVDMFPGIAIVIITASDKGCFIFDKKFSYVAGVQIDVTDAVGAGDAFSAAFMHSYFRTGDTLRAAKIANEVGAYVTTKNGAIPTYSDPIRQILGMGRSTLDENPEVTTQKNASSVL